MSNRYDKKTTTFNQQGRLFQVEYAIEATKTAAPALGVLAKEGLILVGEKKTTSKLLDQGKQAEKIFEIDDHIVCAVAGLSSDATLLIGHLQLYAQQYTFAYGVPIPLEQLCIRLCDLKQQYTQTGGQRPFGVSFLFAGYDRHHGFQLYKTDPSGQYEGWKAHSIGSWDNATTNSALKQDWKPDQSLDTIKELVGKVMIKNGDTSSPDPEKYEITILTKDENGKVYHKKMPNAEVEAMLTAAKQKDEAS